MKNTIFLSAIYLFALLFLGIGYLSIQPIFEGFDETAHYSSIRQITDEGTLPLYGLSYIDKFVVNYQGPFAYGSGEPPYDKNLTYQHFFNHPDLIKNYIKIYREKNFNETYEKSAELNWQVQHPPLYYWLFSKINKLMKGQLSLITQFFILRFFSYLLALGGVLLGLISIKHYLPVHPKAAYLGFIFYPLILPMFIPEFTRIGNDSLCIFLVGLLTVFLSLWNTHQNKIVYGILIGLTLAMGILTKAFFVPITLGIGIFFLIKCWREKQSISSIIKLFIPIIIPILLLGGSWYGYQYAILGHTTNSADMAILAEKGGFLANWRNHYSFAQLIKGMLGIIVTYVWAGSWSLARLNWLLYIPQLILLLWVSVSTILYLKKISITHLIWLPLFILSFFIIGFIYHVFICIAAYGTGNTPGWYLHILMPWVAPLTGLGLVNIVNNKMQKLFFLILLSYAVLFQIIAIWAQFVLYMGCATKGLEKNYIFSSKYFCLDQMTLLYNHLSIIGWPHLAIVSYGLGFLLYVLLFFKKILIK